MKSIISLLAATLFALVLAGPVVGKESVGSEGEDARKNGGVSGAESWELTGRERELLRLTRVNAGSAKIKDATGAVEVGTRAFNPVSARSDSSEIAVRAPRFFFWPGTKKLYVSAGWKIDGFPLDPNKSGGLDGFGLRFSRSVVNYGSYLEYCQLWARPSDNSCKKATSYFENSEQGASWKFQDKESFWMDSAGDHHGGSNIGSGNMLMRIKLLNRKCIQAFGRYAHSFKNAKLTAFGVSTSGFTMGWNTDDNHWVRTGPGGRRNC